jgi:TonB-dependent SusC/RagA subfamily outer membrane receptor
MKKNDDLLCVAQQRWKKTIRIMKLTVGLLLMTMITATAVNTYSQNARISLNVKDATILDIFREIERNSEFGFFYKSEEMNLEKRQSIEVSGATIEDILKKVLDENYTYKILDKNIVVTKGNLEVPSQQQKKTISGKVTDSSGATLPGVSVIVKGTTIGVITESNGSYSLSNVPENATLQFSFVGMKTQEIAVGGKSSINITLEEETVGIEEVVAIGYGTVKKSDLSGSIGTVKGAIIAGRNTMQISTALQGSMSGVTVTRNNNAPGSSATILIRGITTIGDSNPLIIVDGVPRDNINDVNPNDVESLSVLKDAASASIYGSRAAAGVILVTTKRGKTGELNLDYNFEYGFEKPTQMSEYVRANRYMQMVNETRWNDNSNVAGGDYPLYSKDRINNYSSLHTENPDLYLDKTPKLTTYRRSKLTTSRRTF